MLECVEATRRSPNCVRQPAPAAVYSVAMHVTHAYVNVQETMQLFMQDGGLDEAEAAARAELGKELRAHFASGDPSEAAKCGLVSVLQRGLCAYATWYSAVSKISSGQEPCGAALRLHRLVRRIQPGPPAPPCHPSRLQATAPVHEWPVYSCRGRTRSRCMSCWTSASAAVPHRCPEVSVLGVMFVHACDDSRAVLVCELHTAYAVPL